jgi:hypothetical protein
MFDQSKNQWNLYDFTNNLLRTYYKNEVKLMVVWNMHCFSSKAQQLRFHSEKNNQLSLGEIMSVFKEDLKEKNSLPNDKLDPIDLWTITLKEYLKYPVNTKNQNSTFLGINYCLLPKIMPDWINNNILNPLLVDRC